MSSPKIANAVAFLKKNGYEKVPHMDINASKIIKEFYITYAGSYNGIALVELISRDRNMFRITYFNSTGEKRQNATNQNFRPYVTPHAPQFGTFTIPAGKLRFRSYMWYKPNQFFSLKPITLEQLNPPASPVPRPVVPVVPTSNRVGGRTRHRKKQRFSSRNSMATKRNLVRKSRKGTGLFGKTCR